MIMKVKHSIKPGDMTTTFTGCRMANVSNKLVEDIFTDEDILGDDSEISAYDNGREMKADIDNDCPYKIYPLYGDSSTVQLSGDAKKDGVAILNKLIGLGYNEWAAAGIVGNMYVESYDYKNTKKAFKYDLVVEDNSTTTKGTSGGLCMWRNGYLEDLANKKTTGLGQNKTIIHYSEAARQSYSNKLNANGLDFQLEYLKATMTPGGGSWVPLKFADYNSSSLASKSPKSCAAEFQKKYERPAKIDSKRGEAAEDFYQAYKSGNYTSNSQPTDKNPNDKKDVTVAFFDAVNRSAQDTPSIGVKLNNIGNVNGYLRINQANGKTDKLGVVFDMILNSEYYNYVQELGWVYPNGGLETDVSPDVIFCKVTQSPNANSKSVWAAIYGSNAGSRTTPEIPTADGSSNKLLLKSLGKRYAKLGEDKFKKEVPQVKDTKNLEKYKPQDCNSLFSSNGGTNSANPSEISPNDAGSIDGWDVGKACAWIISHNQGCRTVGGKTKCGISKCASYVEDAIAAGGGPLKNRMSCGGNGHATNLRYHGILEKNGFVQIDSGTVSAHGNPTISLQAGDVAILGPESGGKYHACLYTASKGWCSDFIQRNMNVYSTSQPYAIYRFHNKKKS